MALDLTKFLARPTATNIVEEPLATQVEQTQPVVADSGAFSFTKYGVTPNENAVGFTKLNELLDKDGIAPDAKERFDIQQQWLKNLDSYIEQSQTPEEKASFEKVKQNVLQRALKADSFWGSKGESFGKGVDAAQAGASLIGANAFSHLDKSDIDLAKEIEAENPEKFKKYLEASAKLNKELNDFSANDFAGDANSAFEMRSQNASFVRGQLPKEEQDLLDWFDKSLEAKRVGATFGKDANAVTQWLSKTAIANLVEANQKSKYVGKEARRDAIKQAGLDENGKSQGIFNEAYETAKSFILDPSAGLDIALESTGSQAIPQIAGILAWGATRNPMAYQVVSSLGNFPAEVQGQFVEALQPLAQKKYKRDLGSLTPEELNTLIQENKGVASKALDDGMKSAAVIALTEPLVAKGVGKLALNSEKLATNPAVTSSVLKGFGITGSAALKFTGEGWEEALGQIASNIALGEDWDKGVGSSFVMALAAVENIPNTLAIKKDVQNMLAKETGESNTETDQTETTEPQGGDSNLPPEIDQPTGNTPNAEEPVVEDTTDLSNTRRAMVEEYARLRDKQGKTPEEIQRMDNLAVEYSKIAQETTDDGIVVDGNIIADAKVISGDQVSENRNSNRDGSEDADGTVREQRTDETQPVGQERSGEIDKSVSSDETEALTTGYSQSNTGTTADLTGKQDNISQTSDTVGSDGRSRETDGSAVEQGKLGGKRSEQDTDPTQEARSGNPSVRVQQRAESDSVGEALAKPTDAELEETSQRLFGKPVNDLPHAEHQEVINITKRLKAIKQRNNDREEAEPKVEKTKPKPAEVKKAEMAKPFVKENKINRAIDAATSPKYDFTKATDLRDLQKQAHIALQANPNDVGLIKSAFMASKFAKGKYKENSWGVAKNGYVQLTKYNTDHKSYLGNNNILGISIFTNTPVYENQIQLFDPATSTVEEQITMTLAEQPETTQEIMAVTAKTFFTNEENAKVRSKMEDAVEKFAEQNNISEDDGTKILGTFENLHWAANRSDFMDWVDAKLRPYFEGLRKIVAGVIAVIAVGAMSTPTDAMAQQGFSTFTQGEVVQGVSQEVSNTINWVKQHKDHHNQNFVVADKDEGKIHIISPDGKVLNTQNALFGKGKGNDRSAMNTPSGRMQLKKETKLNSTEKGIYGDSVLDFVEPNSNKKVRQKDGGIIAMHRVVNKAERKNALNTAKADDNFLSHGCINVPTAFYDKAVDSLDGAMVYVLDHKNAKENTSEIKGKQSLSIKTSGLKPKTSKGLKFSTSHRGSHLAPTNDGFNARLDALDTIYPSDIYSDKAWHYYGQGTPAQDKAVAKKLQSMRGKPEMEVTVYRAVPANVKTNSLVTGDWVTTEKHYAELHGESALNGDYKIIEQTVKVKDLYTNADSLYELGVDFGDNLVTKLSIQEANLDNLNTSLTKAKVKDVLKKTLGKFADRVTLISQEDFANNTTGYEYINRNGIEGFYDPETGHVFLVADNLHKGNGLTAEERVAWVAWHELTHAGLDVKYGEDLQNILATVKDDPFVSQLAQAIQLQRASRNDSPAHVSDLGAVEEAIAEINAAIRSNNLGALTERYGLVVPEAYQAYAKEVSQSFLQKLRNLFNKVLGRKALTSNNQVIQLLKSLPQDIESYAPVASRARTAQVLAQLNDPASAYNQAKLSIGDSISEVTAKAANYILGNTIYRNKRVLDQTGADPNRVATGERQDEIFVSGLNPSEKFVESMVDSQVAAIKFVGGLKTKLGQMIKTTTNKTARVKQEFQKDTHTLLKATQKVAKKAYKKKANRVSIQNDLQNITTALGAISGINAKQNANREKILFDEKYGLEAQLEALGVDLTTGQASQVETSWQADQIAKLWKTYEELKTIHEKSQASMNRLMGKENARDGEDPNRMRENLRMYNGQTTAEAYNRITKAVKQGLINVTVKGKSWEEYIQDVGFTEDVGFADENKSYDIDEKDIDLDGHFAGIVEDYARLSQKVYDYKAKHLGKELAGEGFNNRFEVPTMGKVENMKVETDEDGNFLTKNNKTTKDKIDLAEATEYQSMRLGRAFLGANAIQNLNMLIDLTAQQTQFNPLFQELYDQRNDENAVKIKVFDITTPEFNLMKGAILHVDVLNQNGKPTGVKKYVKVALDDAEATAALFGDNVQTLDSTVMGVLQVFTRISSLFMTFDPTFGVYNAYRGLNEKFTQIGAGFGNGDSSYFTDAIDAESSAIAKALKSNNFAMSTSIKPLLWSFAMAKLMRNFFSYIPAAAAMSLYIIDKKGVNQHGNWLFTKEQKKAYQRLLDAYNGGTITTRAESSRLSPEELQALYNSYNAGVGGIFGTIFKTAPQRTVTALNQLQEYMQYFTTTGELVSTLLTQDVLTEAGMDLQKANEANLYFMNFNDRGASKTSAYVRAAIPFANAAAQGGRSTVRVLNKKGLGILVWGVASSYALMSLSALLQDMYPCEDDQGRPFENKNTAELQRDITFRMGCSGEFRLPIEYGAGAIFHTMGTAVYQLFQGNWDWETSSHYIIDTILENTLPFPLIPDNKSQVLVKLGKSLMPTALKSMINTYTDIDDFGNPLSSKAAEDKDHRYAFGKPNTPAVWAAWSEWAYNLGFNPSPEQTRYLAQAFVGAWTVDIVSALDGNLKEEESRLGKFAFAVSGAKRAYREPRDASQKTFIETANALNRQAKLVDVIDKATELGDDDAGKLKFGKESGNLLTWLNKLEETGKYSQRELEIIRIIGEYKKQQKQISSKKLTAERKHELYFENNKKLLSELRPYNQGDK